MVDKIFEESWMVLLIYIIYLSFSWMVAMYFYAVMDLYLCINLHLPAHFWRVFFFFWPIVWESLLTNLNLMITKEIKKKSFVDTKLYL